MESITIKFKTQYLFNDGFVKLFEDKPFWDNIGWMDKVSIDFIYRYEKNMTINGWLSLLEHKNLDTSDIIKILEHIPTNETDKLNQAWEFISNSQTLDNDFIDKYHEKLNWKDICLFYPLDWETIQKYSTYIQLRYLSNNDCMTNELANKIKNSNLFTEKLDDKDYDKIDKD